MTSQCIDSKDLTKRNECVSCPNLYGYCSEFIQTGSSEVLMKFTTYSSYTEGGFQFRFMAIEKNRINTCDSSNKKLLAESTPQYIISPRFPSAYPSDLQCSWSVESALKKKDIGLVFEFRSQYFEDGYEGCADYVKINGLEDIDECKKPGICHHKCENTQGSYICRCINGYKLIDERDCQDIDECASADCDQCHNFPGGFQCSCSEGYRLDATTKKDCYNIDECFEHVDNCSENALCIDTDGSFCCSCLSGFRGNGLTCTEIPIYFILGVSIPILITIIMMANICVCNQKIPKKEQKYISNRRIDFNRKDKFPKSKKDKDSKYKIKIQY